MSDLKKIGLLFLACLILAIYSKLSGNIPSQLGTHAVSTDNVLGTQTSQPSFAHLVPK